MPNTYFEAPAVREVAEKLILAYHPHLVGRRIEYLFRSEQPVIAGKPIASATRKITGLNAFLATSNPEFELTNEAEENPDAFFVIEVCSDLWNVMKEETREALVDHELCHCGVELSETKDGTASAKIVLNPHDFEEFSDVVKRHGLWQEDVARFYQVARRRELGPDAADTTAAPKVAKKRKAPPAASQDELDHQAGYAEAVVDDEPVSCTIELDGEHFLLTIRRKRDARVLLDEAFDVEPDAWERWEGYCHIPPALKVVEGGA